MMMVMAILGDCDCDASGGNGWRWGWGGGWGGVVIIGYCDEMGMVMGMAMVRKKRQRMVIGDGLSPVQAHNLRSSYQCGICVYTIRPPWLYDDQTGFGTRCWC